MSEKVEVYKNVSDLRPGSILKEDIYSHTKYPIIRKETTLALEHFSILFAFGIRKVKVEEPISGKQTPNMTIEPVEEVALTVDVEEVLESIPIRSEVLHSAYTLAVTKYKKEFLSWRAGKKPDLTAIRAFVIPLIKDCLEHKNIVNSLNDFSESDDYIYHHAIAVGILASLISKELGYSDGQILQIGLAGTLADCGMAKINPTILNSAAFLSREEFNEVKKHVIYSYQMIQDSSFLRQEMKVAIFQHHERIDGSGYPRGDKLNDISEFAQILAVADVFHAMTSERRYRAKESPFKVIEMIKEEEFGKFSLRVVQALHNLVASLSIGNRILLTTGEVAEVMFIHRDATLRPLVKRQHDGFIIDLNKNRTIAIEKVLQT